MSTDNKDIIEISTLKLNVNGIILEVKAEQARELWRKLDEIFGPKPATWIYPNWQYGISAPIRTDNPIWINEPSLFGDRITCNAYTGNTLELR